jgi:hypothetical protein
MKSALTLLMLVALAGCTVTPSGSPTTAAPDSDHDPCLIGHWESAPGEVSAFVTDLAIGGNARSAEADGTFALTFAADGSLSYRPDATFTIVTNPKGVVRSGTLGGSADARWETDDDGRLRATNVDNNLMLDIDGTEVHDLYGWTTLPFPYSSYTCTDENLTVEFNIASVDADLQFARAT